MKYLLLIYENEADWAKKSEAEQGAIFGEYSAFSDDLRKGGQYLHGEPLQPTATASTVRVRNGKTMVTDGPFAETREQLGGFYLVDVPDLDQALALAARIPTARDGSVEVRPVLDFGG
jgi:hypothetical protein